MFGRLRFAILLFWGFASCSNHLSAGPAADSVYRNGYVYTVGAIDSVQQALAVRAGRIVFVGSDSEAGRYVGPETKVIDLQGRMMMPGLVDGHMHPLQGGAIMNSCSLNYEP